jgi:hypothetical protein
MFWRKRPSVLSRADTAPNGEYDINYPEATRRTSTSGAAPGDIAIPTKTARAEFFVRDRRAMHKGPTSRDVWVDRSDNSMYVNIHAYPDVPKQTPDEVDRVINEIIIQIGMKEGGGADHVAIICFASSRVPQSRTARANLAPSAISKGFASTAVHGDAFFDAVNAQLRKYNIDEVLMDDIVDLICNESREWAGKSTDSVDISRILAVIAMRMVAPAPTFHTSPRRSVIYTLFGV